MTTRLFNIIQSELINNGVDEFIDENGKIIFFENDKQITRKILLYDNDVQKVVNELMIGIELENPEHDMHFKKAFVYKFINRRINRQTVEAFQFELFSTFLTQQDYINTIYQDLDKYILKQSEGEQTNNQNNTQTSTSVSSNDSRSAYANLPQSNLNLDVDNTNMETADDNTVSRSKQATDNTNENNTSGNSNDSSKQYALDELIKSKDLLKNVFDMFDVNCFMQIF